MGEHKQLAWSFIHVQVQFSLDSLKNAMGDEPALQLQFSE